MIRNKHLSDSITPNVQQAFGLRFQSDRAPFGELTALTPPAQTAANSDTIRIQWGDTPAALPEPFVSRGLYQARQDALLLTVPDVGRYHVAKDCITVSPAPQANDETVRLFLFGSAVGTVLHLNNILALHGSAVRLPDGGAAVFTGVSTAGKSTLAAALAAKGHASMADDIVAVHFDSSGQAWVHPGLSRTKLWNDALSLLDLHKESGRQVRPHLDKYSMPMQTWGQPERLTHVYELLPVERGEVTKNGVKGLEKLTLLDRQTFRPNFVEAMGLKATHLQRLGRLAPQVHVAQITRPRGQPTLDEIINLIERDWK
jgi:hypothetical protein